MTITSKDAGQVKPTEGPWDTDGVYVIGIDGQTVADCSKSGTIPRATQRANAAFIVRACYSHEELVKALELARGYVADDIKRNPSEYDPRSDLVLIDAALGKARI